MIIARQSTARTVTVGPVLDADGVAVTGGVVADFKISKNGGAPAALNGSATLTHRHTGHYSLALTATDLDTVGQAEIVIDDTVNACPAKELTVIEEAAYDVWFAASATGAVLLQATQTGVTIPTVTTLTNLPAITSNWLTAAGIATGAITNAKFAAGAIDASAIASNAFASAKFAADFFTSIITAVWTTAATRVLTAATNLTTALATPTNITAGTITTVSGNVTGSVGSIASGGITAASLDATVQARLGIVAFGTAQSATGTTLVLASASAFADDELIGSVVVITGGTTGVGQARVITDYVGSTDTATVDTWTTTPTGTITYVVFAAAPASATALPAVNVTQFGGSAGTFASGRPEVNTTHAAGTAWGSGAITAASIAADAITDAKVSSDVTIASVTGSVGSIATGGITAASIATGAIDADALAADAGTEIADAVLDRAITEPSGVFAWGAASLRTVIQLVGAMARNKQTQTATTFTLRNDADSGTIATATVSDDGTTTTKGELS
jgi:hypothetical protein